MQSRCELVDGLDEHVSHLVGRLRLKDQVELYRSTGGSPDDALIGSWNRANKRWAILLDEKPVALAGVVVSWSTPEVAVPWLLATDDAERIPRSFNRKSKEVLNEMFAIRSTLANYVDAENDVSIRWLKWLGFRLLDPVPYGPFRAPFHPFMMVGRCAMQAQ